MDTVAQTLSDMIPKSLDDIVRKNRELIEIRLATEDEVANIPGDVVVTPERDEVSNYRLVAIQTKRVADGSNSVLSVHILGTNRGGESWATSAVVGLNIERGYANTRTGSVYKLRGAPAHDEPGRYDLMCFCALLNHWGVGPLLDVAPFFY